MKTSLSLSTKVLLTMFLPLVFTCYQQSAAKRMDGLYATPQTYSLNKEFLPVKQMRINGSMPMQSSFKKLKVTFGKPDSIITPDMNDVCASAYDKKFDWCHIKGLTFEKYGDTVVFSSVDYSKGSNIYLSFGKLKLDKTTSLSAIKKQFPISSADISDIKMAEGTFDSIRLPLAETISDDSFLLLFDKKSGRLIRVSYYMPC